MFEQGRTLESNLNYPSPSKNLISPTVQNIDLKLKSKELFLAFRTKQMPLNNL